MSGLEISIKATIKPSDPAMDSSSTENKSSKSAETREAEPDNEKTAKPATEEKKPPSMASSTNHSSEGEPNSEKTTKRPSMASSSSSTNKSSEEKIEETESKNAGDNEETSPSPSSPKLFQRGYLKHKRTKFFCSNSEFKLSYRNENIGWEVGFAKGTNLAVKKENQNPPAKQKATATGKAAAKEEATQAAKVKPASKAAAKGENVEEEEKEPAISANFNLNFDLKGLFQFFSSAKKILQGFFGPKKPL